MKKRIIILGATGMIGGHAMQICLDSPDVEQVTIIVRKSTNITHPKLKEIIHADFMNFEKLHETLKDQDAALFCLGAYTGTLPDDKFKQVTVDMPETFAKALSAASPQATFCLLSGRGADRKEKSRIAFARYKGMIENILLRMKFPHVFIFRPSYIYPVVPRQEPNLMYKISRWLYPALKRLSPNASVPSTQLAQAMVHVAINGSSDHQSPIFENNDIRIMKF